MRRRFKTLSIWFVCLSLLCLLASSLVRELGGLLTYFHKGADPASALHIVPNEIPNLYLDFKWQTDDQDAGRQMDPFARAQIQDAYTRAWLQWNLSYLKGQPYGLSTYFVGPALQAVKNSVEQEANKGYQISQIDTAHSLKLHFYSADGSIVSFTDTNALVAHVIRDKSGSILFSGENSYTYNVVMFLEDGNWRIRHWVKAGEQTPDIPPSSPPNTDFVTVNGTLLSINDQPYPITGINYYPKDTPWDTFWLHYNGFTTDKDFALLESLGINAVRIFVPFYQFGGAEVGNNPKPEPGSNVQIVGEPLEKVKDLLKGARQHKLRVIITLFDLHSDYTLLHWPQTTQYLKTILTRFRNDSTILAWDLKNEPDLDYKAAGKETVTAWLKHIAHMARIYDPNHLLTVGWATPMAAQEYISGLDFISFHFYRPASELPEAYTALRNTHPDRPILITEFGMSTWNGISAPAGHTEAEQATYYADIFKFWRTTQSPGTFCWTLYDFTYIPKGLFGNYPWQAETQKHFGIVRTDGSRKPAAALVAYDAKLDTQTLTVFDTWLKPFRMTLALLLICAILLLIPTTRRYFLQHIRAWIRTIQQVRELRRTNRSM